MNSPTPPKGSLEDLFRHHLLESEAAAVPPRPHVWEQLDNSLLLAQNESYRRHLRVHRWAIAASLLLAMLAGGGWWHSQQPTASLTQATPTGAAAQRPAGQSVAGRAGRQSAARPGQLASSPVLATTAVAPTIGPVSSSANLRSIDQLATSSLSGNSSNSAATSGAERRRLLAFATTAKGSATVASHRRSILHEGSNHRTVATGSLGRSLEGNDSAAGSLAIATAANSNTKAFGVKAGQSQEPGSITSNPTTRSTSTFASANEAGAANQQLAALAANQQHTLATADGSAQAGLTSQQVAAAEALATRMAQLALPAGQSLPTALAALPLPEVPAPTVMRRWQFGLAYATSAFQPNIDFTKESGAYNPALGVNSAHLTQLAAAEYRQNLRAGLGQRLSLWATRRLGNGRFGLRMGLELAQNTASSASSVAFVGEQVPDLSYTMPAPLRATSYRYRSASVPVEFRYGNPLKAGFSLYGRLGGLLTALLNVRSEVAGNEEATRTYTLLSASSPYRRVSASVRGGVGMQYRPTGHQWALSLGPIAEAGILSLNNDPTQDFLSQKRPYSFGLEAGIELGRSARLLVK